MSDFVDPNNSGLIEGGLIHGYRIQRIIHLKENHSVLYELEHTELGTKHIHISRADAENTFSVAFKTVPTDSTGVAHILEHTVLCGSEKYPVRDPFFSMLKRSLSTFMNAFTASDWTMYPFSTQNRKDFYNLMQVYLDAAFFPKLDPLSFKQEGHRLEIVEAPDGNKQGNFRLSYKGVVYNEMKGAMSSPDQVMVRSILKAMYPDTTYSHNSGGDPVVIPTLTYDQLKEFHRRHYHPSNSFFFTYGDLALDEHLAVITQKVLDKFSPIDPATEVAAQPRWQAPQTAKFFYPLAKSEDPAKKCQVCIAWLVADTTDAFEVLTLSLLEQILLGNSASPLRKALIDSQLGTALCDGSGFDADNRDTLFVCGLKDVEPSAAAKIENIVFDVLNDLVRKGIDQELIESAIHQIEFRRKEITNTPYPYGIKLLLTIAGSWLHGGDPAKILKFDADIRKIRHAAAKDPFFENKIKTYFLENPHRGLLTLMPDHEMEQKEAVRCQDELDQIKQKLSPAAIERIKQDSKALLLLQESEEDISCLPTLERKEIPPAVTIIEESAFDKNLSTTIYNQETSGILYFAGTVGAGSVPPQLMPLVPFFCYAFSRQGTGLHDYSELARLIDSYTGGISLAPMPRTRYDENGSCLPLVAIAAKCIFRNQARMFEIVQELLHHVDFSDLQRLKSLLLEYRANLESMIVHSGHRLAISLASRNFSPARALSETWSGVHQLKTLKSLTADMSDDSLSTISRDLGSMPQFLFTRRNFLSAVIGEGNALKSAKGSLASIRDGFTAGRDDGFRPPETQTDKALVREGWSISSAVSFVAQAFETVRMNHEDAPALAVISKLLRSLYLHREIREKGGAYGGFAIYNPEDGIFSFGSYRDPHIASTLDVYSGAVDFIRAGGYTEEDIKEALLQVCAEIDKPDPPGPAARKAFYRKIVSLSDEMRSQFKTRLLALSRSQVIQAAEKYFDGKPQNKSVAVISNEEKLKSANQKLADNPLALFRI
jgi:Zn-dependent M16 (insulinase) family peptidase